MSKTIILIILSFLYSQLSGQTIAIRAKALLDVKAEKLINNVVVIVYKNKIIEINYNNHVPDTASIIDLKNCTLLPGLIDGHTHIMTNGENYEIELYSHSSVYRALRATSQLKTSLLNGFTTIRDVGNEGTGFADIDLSRCLEEGLIDGPRFISSGKGMAIKGFYFPITINQNWQFDFPNGAQMVSGKDECIEAVREQFSEGAKWIKVYLDWGTTNGIKTIFSAEE